MQDQFPGLSQKLQDGWQVCYVCLLKSSLICDRAHCKTMRWLLCIASTTENSRYKSAFMILCQVVDLIQWMYYFTRLIVFAGRKDRENFKKFGVEKTINSFPLYFLFSYSTNHKLLSYLFKLD